MRLIRDSLGEPAASPDRDVPTSVLRADARVLRPGDDYVADAARACTLTAEQEEGPFYVALDDVREEIVLGRLKPYSGETDTIVTHADDRVWTGQHGSEGLMKFARVGHTLSKGLIGSLTMAVNPSATPALIGATSGVTTGPTGTPPSGVSVPL